MMAVVLSSLAAALSLEKSQVLMTGDWWDLSVLKTEEWLGWHRSSNPLRCLQQTPKANGLGKPKTNI